MHQPSGSHRNCFFFSAESAGTESAAAAGAGAESTAAVDTGLVESDSLESFIVAVAGAGVDVVVEAGVESAFSSVAASVIVASWKLARSYYFLKASYYFLKASYYSKSTGRRNLSTRPTQPGKTTRAHRINKVGSRNKLGLVLLCTPHKHVATLIDKHEDEGQIEERNGANANNSCFWCFRLFKFV